MQITPFRKIINFLKLYKFSEFKHKNVDSHI